MFGFDHVTIPLHAAVVCLQYFRMLPNVMTAIWLINFVLISFEFIDTQQAIHPNWRMLVQNFFAYPNMSLRHMRSDGDTWDIDRSTRIFANCIHYACVTIPCMINLAGYYHWQFSLIHWLMPVQIHLMFFAMAHNYHGVRHCFEYLNEMAREKKKIEQTVHRILEDEIGLTLKKEAEGEALAEILNPEARKTWEDQNGITSKEPQSVDVLSKYMQRKNESLEEASDPEVCEDKSSIPMIELKSSKYLPHNDELPTEAEAPLHVRQADTP